MSMGVKAVLDVTTLDHIVGDNDVEIKLVRDEEGEVAAIFAVQDTIVRLSPVDKLVSYLISLVMDEATEYLTREEPKPDWRAKNKD